MERQRSKPEDDPGGRQESAPAHAGADSGVPWSIMILALLGGLTVGLINHGIAAAPFVAGVSLQIWMLRRWMVKTSDDSRHGAALLATYWLLWVGGVTIGVVSLLPPVAQGPVGRTLVSVAATAYAVVWFFGYPTRTTLRRRIGIPSSFAPRGSIATATAAASDLFAKPWIGKFFGRPGQRQQPGWAFVAVFAAIGCALAPVAEGVLAVTRVAASKHPGVTLAMALSDEAMARLERELIEEATDTPAVVSPAPASEQHDDGVEATLPPGPAAVGACTWEEVLAQLEDRLSPTMRDEFFGVWTQYGAVEVGCPSGPVERLGALSLIRLAEGRSDPSVLVGAEPGRTALVFEQLVDDLFGSGSELAWVDLRQGFGLGDFQLFHFVDGSCSLFVRLYEQDDYTQLPPAVTAIAAQLAVRRNGIPFVRSIRRAVNSVEYDIGFASFGSPGIAATEPPVVVVLDTASDLAEYEGGLISGDTCPSVVHALHGIADALQ